MTLEELKQKIIQHTPQANLEQVEAAYRFAKLAHEGQFRVSGEEYIQHPLEVAAILADLELDITTIAASLLHDVVEDTAIGMSEIEAQFGKEMVLLVDGVTKLSRLEYRSREEEQAENLRKMFLAMAKDIRVVMIKLADRLHNMRTLKHLPPHKQREVADETLEVYAPLAHRLGMWRIKWELEDLAFRYKEPDKYRELAEKVSMKRREREEFISSVIASLRERLEQVGLKADIQGRAKHLYSIYKKMQEQSKDIDQIFDLLAVRVIVDTVKDCYGTLGIVHTLWKPIPGRFKDYIAMPKANMYQSLHTSVIGPNGEPFEVQIRTVEMHRTAEYGIAAHWRYKEGGKTSADFDAKLSWLRQLLEWQRDLKDAKEFMESLKIDLFDDEVFVFTPKGAVIDLPAGATPIDFAYQIHTEVGHRCVGAKVNGKIVPLDYKLKNGDIVEILTSKSGGGPSPDWLNIVVTSGAKGKIRSWFKKEKKEENILKGREALEREAKRLGFESHALCREDWINEIAKRLNYQDGEDLLAAIGYGGVTAQYVVGKLHEEYKKENKVAQEDVILPSFKEDPKGWDVYSKSSQGVRVKGIDNVLIRFSRCCSPIPGDPIIGYITRGRGVSVHRLDCPNVPHLIKDGVRLIEVAWDGVNGMSYPVELEIDAIDRPGLLSDVANIMAETRTNILSARVRTQKSRFANIDLVIEIKDLDHLQFITQKVGRIRDVIKVGRVAREGS